MALTKEHLEEMVDNFSLDYDSILLELYSGKMRINFMQNGNCLYYEYVAYEPGAQIEFQMDGSLNIQLTSD